MSRVEQLSKHLNTILQLEGNYAVDIANVVAELNAELGIKSDTAISTYSTRELHEELAKRINVFEVRVEPYEEAVVTVVTGDVDRLTYSYHGPTRILVNQD